MNNGKCEIVICLGSSCFSRGNKDALEVIKSYLKAHKIECNILFKGQLCSQACNKGPVIWINHARYEAVSAVNVIPLLDQVLGVA